MKVFGMEMVGRFTIEKIPSLPEWSPYDEGRLVYVEDKGSYWMGGITDWIKMPLGEQNIQVNQLDLGTNSNQIHAGIFPVENRFNYFNNANNITVVLENLAQGIDIQDNSIRTRHFADKNIPSTALLTGFIPNAINAQVLPCLDKIDNPLGVRSNIQETLDHILNTTPRIVRKKVQIATWQYNPTEEQYAVDLYYNPIEKDFPAVQCYDEYGHMILPSKIILLPNSRKCTIWVPYKLVLNVVIIG